MPTCERVAGHACAKSVMDANAMQLVGEGKTGVAAHWLYACMGGTRGQDSPNDGRSERQVSAVSASKGARSMRGLRREVTAPMRVSVLDLDCSVPHPCLQPPLSPQVSPTS